MPSNRCSMRKYSSIQQFKLPVVRNRVHYSTSSKTADVIEVYSKKYRYPCTGRTKIEGFPEYLKKELGPSRANLKAFSKELENQFGWKRISLTNSGSSANLAASLAIAEKCMEEDKQNNIQRNDNFLGEAITAGFTFPSTMSSLLSARFKLKVVDTEEGTFNLCPKALENAITEDTRVVCVTHFLGFPANIQAISNVLKKRGGATKKIFLLQDACETMVLNVNGKPLHEYGDISTWSFYHPHHLSSFGGGGVSSPHPDWHALVESIIHWGRECTCHFDSSICRAPDGMHHSFWYVRQGHNIEMSELNACFGRFQLRDWKEMEDRRIYFYDILYNKLKDMPDIKVYNKVDGCGSPFVFPITLKSKSIFDVKDKIGERGVEIRSLMGGAITKQPAYANISNDGLKNCLSIGEKSFFVGIHQTLKEEDVRDVAMILKEELA